jgi:hypothetical protein
MPIKFPVKPSKISLIKIGEFAKQNKHQPLIHHKSIYFAGNATAGTMVTLQRARTS